MYETTNQGITATTAIDAAECEWITVGHNGITQTQQQIKKVVIRVERRRKIRIFTNRSTRSYGKVVASAADPTPVNTAASIAYCTSTITRKDIIDNTKSYNNKINNNNISCNILTSSESNINDSSIRETKTTIKATRKKRFTSKSKSNIATIKPQYWCWALKKYLSLDKCLRTIIMTLAVLLITAVNPVHSLDPGIDLLAELNLYSNFSSYHGVSLTTQGFHNGSMAFRLQSNDRKLILPMSGFQRTAELLRKTSEFTITAVLKQDRANTGSIIAFSYGPNRYLELESSGKRDEIRFHFSVRTAQGLQVHTETFSYQLADEAWHKVALAVSGPEIQLLIDCHPLYKRVNHFIPDRNFSASNMQLFVGQRNLNNHSVFKGFIQSAHVIAKPHGYLSQCPHMHEQCPTCAQFSLLQRTIEDLQKHLTNVTQRLVATESRITRLEECECKISCKINGASRNDGEEWNDGCNVCKCERGSITCGPPKCEPTPCKNAVYENGACCPKCLKKCYLKKQEYEHGDSHMEGCRNCSCHDGSMSCEKINCPKLNCSSGEIIQPKDECCEVCKGDDYCSKGHACHTNATCLNLYTKYTCTCRQGFQGDGFHCTDVDECAQQGGLNGNHCHYNTRCVNTQGSYVCECLSGYRRLDKYNCVEIDECASDQHACHDNANCINTQGSYHCECKDGYLGNGYDCRPVCNQTCLHGGQCSAPNICTCRMGYIGNACEQDLDECAAGLHNCKESSACVNMPGWYFCKCKPGYHTLGPECIDIDECKRETHSCHPTAQCVNTPGHFECHCAKKTSQSVFTQSTLMVTDRSSSLSDECRLSCIFEDVEVLDGAVISPRNQPCKKCTCRRGVITCEEPKCNCSNWKPASGRDLCCPQCDIKESCRHQELDHVIFRSGEQWIYQCQTCECLYGEFDCWKLQCPPLTCENPLPLEAGDCCPRCSDDPCNYLANVTAISAGQPCVYQGHQYLSGENFNDPSSQCTTCGCKDGQLFCSVDNSCTDRNSESNWVPASTLTPKDITTTAKYTEAVSANSTKMFGATSTAFRYTEDAFTSQPSSTSQTSARTPKHRLARQTIKNDDRDSFLSDYNTGTTTISASKFHRSKRLRKTTQKGG